MLSTFLSEYLKESGADQGDVLDSIPYYLSTQTQQIWFDEKKDTDQTKDWMRELSIWATNQKTFSVDSLKNFIEKETKDNHIKWAGDLSFIFLGKFYMPDASGKVFRCETGQSMKFSINVIFDKPFISYISPTNVGVEFWTDANTGEWHSAGSLEFVGFLEENKVHFSGELPITKASGNTPYEVTVVVSLCEKEESYWIILPHGNAKIWAVSPFQKIYRIQKPVAATQL